MRLALRPMHEAEVPLVRDTWTRSIDANEVRAPSGRKSVISGRYRTVGGGTCPWLRVGEADQVVAWAWHDMHRAWVRSLWPSLVVLVATLPGHDEALGWVAYTPAGARPLVVHYVYTIDLERARRRGVAATLVRAALSAVDMRAPRFSHMTPAGQRVLARATAAPVAQMRDEAVMT
jgi:hypothetical protein